MPQGGGAASNEFGGDLAHHADDDVPGGRLIQFPLTVNTQHEQFNSLASRFGDPPTYELDSQASLGNPSVVLGVEGMEMTHAANRSHGTVVLLGKLGHGKTALLNMICGEAFESNMGIETCSRVMQVGKSLRRGISIIDTPGFYSCKDTSEHIAQQKSALEGERLNGIFAVVKFGRSDDMVDILNQIMDFCGDDDIRILVTHTDIATEDGKFDPAETRDLLAEYLDVLPCNIGFVGKGCRASCNDDIMTTSEEVEDFICSTLHRPRSFKVSAEQSAYMSSRSPGSRQFEKELEVVYAKIDAAQNICESINDICESSISIQCLNDVKNTSIIAVQKLVKRTADNAKESIRLRASGLAASELNLIHANVNVKLKLRVDRFLSKTDNRNPQKFDSYSGSSERLLWSYSSYNTISASSSMVGKFEMDSDGQSWVVKFSDKNRKEVSVAELSTFAFEMESLTTKSRAEREKWAKRRSQPKHNKRGNGAHPLSSSTVTPSKVKKKQKPAHRESIKRTVKQTRDDPKPKGILEPCRTTKKVAEIAIRAADISDAKQRISGKGSLHQKAASATKSSVGPMIGQRQKSSVWCTCAACVVLHVLSCIIKASNECIKEGAYCDQK